MKVKNNGEERAFLYFSLLFLGMKTRIVWGSLGSCKVNKCAKNDLMQLKNWATQGRCFLNFSREFLTMQFFAF